MKLVIPHYAEGLKVDWTKTAPLNYKDIAMYITPSLYISFSAIWNERSQSAFEIGHIMEQSDIIDCDDFEDRFFGFQPYVKARLKRVFRGDRESIFFDKEEVDILATMMDQFKLTAVIELFYKGEAVNINDLPLDLKESVENILDGYNAIYPMSIKEYQDYLNTEKVRIVKRIVEEEESEVMKKKRVLKLIGGVIIEGICVAGCIFGCKIIGDNIDALRGNLKDVIMVQKYDKILNKHRK